MTSVAINQTVAANSNLTVLQRMDKKITQVMDSAGHVVIYAFDEAQKEWVISTPRKKARRGPALRALP